MKSGSAEIQNKGNKMRDIGFRFWFKYVKEMISMEDFTQYCNDGHYDFVEVITGNCAGVDAMQYTGLKDKNGVEICEGDICEIMYYTPFGDKTDDYYGEWTITNWMGQFILISGKERLSFSDFSNVISSEYVSGLGVVKELSTTVNVNVIGNIHENPELLEK